MERTNKTKSFQSSHSIDKRRALDAKQPSKDIDKKSRGAAAQLSKSDDSRYGPVKSRISIEQNRSHIPAITQPSKSIDKRSDEAAQASTSANKGRLGPHTAAQPRNSMDKRSYEATQPRNSIDKRSYEATQPRNSIDKRLSFEATKSSNSIDKRSSFEATQPSNSVNKSILGLPTSAHSTKSIDKKSDEAAQSSTDNKSRLGLDTAAQSSKSIDKRSYGAAKPIKSTDKARLAQSSKSVDKVRLAHSSKSVDKRRQGKPKSTSESRNETEATRKKSIKAVASRRKLKSKPTEAGVKSEQLDGSGAEADAEQELKAATSKRKRRSSLGLLPRPADSSTIDEFAEDLLSQSPEEVIGYKERIARISAAIEADYSSSDLLMGLNRLEDSYDRAKAASFSIFEGPESASDLKAPSSLEVFPSISKRKSVAWSVNKLNSEKASDAIQKQSTDILKSKDSKPYFLVQKSKEKLSRYRSSLIKAIQIAEEHILDPINVLDPNFTPLESPDGSRCYLSKEEFKVQQRASALQSLQSISFQGELKRGAARVLAPSASTLSRKRSSSRSSHTSLSALQNLQSKSFQGELNRGAARVSAPSASTLLRKRSSSRMSHTSLTETDSFSSDAQTMYKKYVRPSSLSLGKCCLKMLPSSRLRKLGLDKEMSTTTMHNEMTQALRVDPRSFQARKNIRPIMPGLKSREASRMASKAQTRLMRKLEIIANRQSRRQARFRWMWSIRMILHVIQIKKYLWRKTLLAELGRKAHSVRGSMQGADNFDSKRSSDLLTDDEDFNDPLETQAVTPEDGLMLAKPEHVPIDKPPQRVPTGPVNLHHHAGINWDTFNLKPHFVLGYESKRILLQKPSQRTEEETQQVLEDLQMVDFFCHYPLTIQHRLAKIARYDEVNKQQVIVRCGDVATRYYIILSGQAIATKKVREDELDMWCLESVLTKGMTFGEDEILEKTLQKNTVISRQEMQLLSIKAKDYLKLFGNKENEIPQYVKFLGTVPFLKSWPLDKFSKHPSQCFMMYYRHGQVITHDSTTSEFIYVVHKGTCDALMHIEGVTSNWRDFEKILPPDGTYIDEHLAKIQAKMPRRHMTHGMRDRMSIDYGSPLWEINSSEHVASSEHLSDEVQLEERASVAFRKIGAACDTQAEENKILTDQALHSLAERKGPEKPEKTPLLGTLKSFLSMSQDDKSIESKSSSVLFEEKSSTQQKSSGELPKRSLSLKKVVSPHKKISKQVSISHEKVVHPSSKTSMQMMGRKSDHSLSKKASLSRPPSEKVLAGKESVKEQVLVFKRGSLPALEATSRQTLIASQSSLVSESDQDTRSRSSSRSLSKHSFKKQRSHTIKPSRKRKRMSKSQTKDEPELETEAQQTEPKGSQNEQMQVEQKTSKKNSQKQSESEQVQEGPNPEKESTKEQDENKNNENSCSTSQPEDMYCASSDGPSASNQFIPCIKVGGSIDEESAEDGHAATTKDRGPASKKGHRQASKKGHSPASKKGHGPASKKDHGPASKKDHGPASKKDHGLAAKKDHGPATKAEQDPGSNSPDETSSTDHKVTFRPGTKKKGGPDQHRHRSSKAKPLKPYSARQDPFYARVATLQSGDPFGLDTVNLPLLDALQNKTLIRKCLVSCGAEVIAIKKKFFITFADFTVQQACLQFTLSHPDPSPFIMQQKHRYHLAWKLFLNKMGDDILAEIRRNNKNAGIYFQKGPLVDPMAFVGLKYDTR